METTHRERRSRQRRFGERRRADHPVLLETRLPADRRGAERRCRSGVSPRTPVAAN